MTSSIFMLAVNWASIFSRVGWAVAIFGLLWYLLKQGTLTIDSIERFGKMLDSAGGKILTLVAMTIVFFAAAMGVAYYVIEALENGKLTPDNAMVTLILQFVTGSAFGTALGALINLLGGSSQNTSKGA